MKLLFENWRRYLNEEDVDRPWHDQTFSDKAGEYKVSDILDYAEEHHPKESISVSKLMHNLDPGEYETGDELPGHSEFIKRADKADLSYPLLVIDYPDEEPRYWIADGVHRLWKAVHKPENLKSVEAYIIPNSALVHLKGETR